MIKKIIKENKQIIISVVAALVIFGTIKYSRHKELKDYSITVEGKVIECDMVKLNGACVVKVEYVTEDGVYKTTTNTLYNSNNCFIGNKVKVQYSTKSDLTHIPE
jgi:hypothetical protein